MRIHDDHDDHDDPEDPDDPVNPDEPDVSPKNLQYDFPKMRGGGRRPFGTFSKIRPFWYEW